MRSIRKAIEQEERGQRPTCRLMRQQMAKQGGELVPGQTRNGSVLGISIRVVSKTHCRFGDQT